MADRSTFLWILMLGVAACGGGSSSPPADAGPDANVLDARPDAPPDAAAAPAITSLSPASGIVTTSVTLTGQRLGAMQGTSTVTVAGVTATITSWSDTSIVLTVPDVLPQDAPVVVTTAGGASAPQTFAVILPPTIYVENSIDASVEDTVTVLSFDPTTGAATQVGDPVPTGEPPYTYGGCSQAIAIHIPTRRLFVSGATALAVFEIDPVTGALTAVAGSPFATGGAGAEQVIVNAAGTRAFVANYGSSNITVFDVGADGALAPVTGSPFAGQTSRDNLVLSKDETYLYVNGYEAVFGGFAIDASGALTPLADGTHPGGSAIERRPGTDQFFIPTYDGHLAVWTADATGAVTALAGSPFSLAPPAGGPNGMAFTADGARAYVATDNAGYLLGYALDAAGTPTALAGSPWDVTATTSDISCIAVARDSAYAITLNEAAQSVGVFSLDADGAPTQVTNSPFSFVPATSSASGVAITF